MRVSATRPATPRGRPAPAGGRRPRFPRRAARDPECRLRRDHRPGPDRRSRIRERRRGEALRLRHGRGVPRRAAGRRPRPLRDPRRATTAALLRGASRARGAARARRGANGLLPAARHRRGALVARERRAGLRRRRQREARHQHDPRPDRPDAGERACALARRHERAAGGIARLRGDPRARRRPARARDRRLRARRPGRGRRRHPSRPDAPRDPRAGGAVARDQGPLPARRERGTPGHAGADERGAAPDRGRRHGRAPGCGR